LEVEELREREMDGVEIDGSRLREDYLLDFDCKVIN
jgi:hypothetical protein